MDFLYLYGVYFINTFQISFPKPLHQDLFILFSHIGDPRNAFILYFPLLFAFNKREGKRLLLVAAISEWLNLVLKWCLRGERPYWWVNEAKVNVTVKQFYLTCETGPGSPSGHVMVTCAVGVFVVLFLSNQHVALKTAIWSVYIAIVTLVSLSRIYIAAHFPHQIIFALFIGNVIGIWIWKDGTNPVPRFYLVLSFSLIIFGFLCYGLLSLFFDPGFSIPKAKKWCSNIDFVKVDTTPFYSMVRDAGVLFGIGLSELLETNFETNNHYFSTLSALCQAFVSIFCAKAFDTFPLSTEDPSLFYLLGFLKNCVLVMIVLTIVPFIFKKIRVAVTIFSGGTRILTDDNQPQKMKK